MQHFKNIGSP